ncbi:oxygen-independent coproporphyrinogen III oxidase [Acerihabitans arboris]|uniref:Coproporphyrinogen-III oxidase n=1 Tax=Acerihabitans arboris TaxID=2691583 RepID=A0A845SUP2_9GAMM|nr:oxygen-independent coproporphyrinogen III oxidase [Acerihabitans arboris]NDL64715.1 oxygen-independent coproporphyrinogen III oxidase [Acerihabitans arboris]
MSVPAIEWDSALIQKYNQSGPRYTSYPTALEFSEGYDEAAFIYAVARYPARPLSLYLHLPFCHKGCYFCGCNKIVTRQPEKADRYLDVLEQEILRRAPLFKGRLVTQMHWGGGTPTFLSPAQISRLVALVREQFTIAAGAEMSIEIDPRDIELEMMDHLHAEGFNRISMGVQDFDPEVQRLVNREQDEQLIFDLIGRAKALGFLSTNIDLIYGLPRQTLASFQHTLARVITLNPQRLSVFNYAHMPALFAAQRKIKTADLPDAAQKMDILQHSIAALCDAGYQFIGMDHFARPDDELAVAQRAGRLHRNFQGYTTQGDCDLLGLGISAISMIGDSYVQNQKEMKSYVASVARQGNGLWRGVALSDDDRLRRDVIKALICQFHIDFSVLENRYAVRFTDYFADDIALLRPLERDGLVALSEQAITVTAKGRLLIRNICMCFDIYLRNKSLQRQFSRVI